jgi:predicted glutamine amidotransferase
MCEIFAVAWEEPQPLEKALLWAREVERLGIARFGWGVAWISGDGRLRGYRKPTSLADDPEGSRRIAEEFSSRALIHLRRPSVLSTVQLADTQPFLHERGKYAFAHNGYLKRHKDYRPRYEDVLEGKADSEVGFRLFDSLLESQPPAAALRAVHEELAGTANLGYLSADGELNVYGGHRENPLWKFRYEGATVACTGLHSHDDSLFALLFRDAQKPEVLERETATVGPRLAR